MLAASAAPASCGHLHPCKLPWLQVCFLALQFSNSRFRYTIHGKPPGRLPHSTPTIELYISRHRQRNGQLRPWYLRACAWIPVPFESTRTRAAGSASRPYTAEGGCIASLFLFVTKSLNLNIMHPFWQLMGLNNGMCNNETICGIFKRFS